MLIPLAEHLITLEIKKNLIQWLQPVQGLYHILRFNISQPYLHFQYFVIGWIHVGVNILIAMQ